MSAASHLPPHGPRSRTAMSLLLVLAWFGAPACGSSSSSVPLDGSEESGVAGNASSGGSNSQGGAAAGASGADAVAGVSSGGASAAGSSGASGGGRSAAGASSGGAAGASGSGGTAGRGCPALAPTQAAGCTTPTPLGITCFYDDCGGSGVRKKASCTTAIPAIGNPVQQWMVETSACEQLDCANTTCSVGQACVIFEGGARFGQCAAQSCGTGPIECNCVTGCYPGCVLSNFGTGATFTCNTCSDPRGCP